MNSQRDRSQAHKKKPPLIGGVGGRKTLNPKREKLWVVGGGRHAADDEAPPTPIIKGGGESWHLIDL